MVTVCKYILEYDQKKKAHRVIVQELPLCPICKEPLSGYDTRRRHVINSAGDAYWLLLPRLRCWRCGKIHVAAPSFVEPRKHYEAAVIASVRAGHEALCPADNSTIRRWRR